MHNRLIRLARLALLASLALVFAPRPAAADFLIEPFFAWARNPPLSTSDQARWHPGGGVGVDWTFGSLIAGGEIGYASSFFDPPQDAFDLIETSYILTASGQFGISVPAATDRHFYPYATAGLGILRQQARDRAGLVDITRNDPAWNIGAGARWMFNDLFGVRGEARYFRDLRQPFDSSTTPVTNLSPLAFWRVSVGGVIRFGE